MRIIRNKASAGGSCGIVVTLLVWGPDPANHFLPLGFDLANKLLRCGGLWIVGGAPACQLEHHRQEIEPLGRRFVDHLSGVVGVWTAGQNAASFELLEPCGQDVRRNSFVGGEEFTEVAPAHNDQIPQDE